VVNRWVKTGFANAGRKILTVVAAMMGQRPIEWWGSET
jgi:hypothetical protein